jgi:hypothetical protein
MKLEAIYVRGRLVDHLPQDLHKQAEDMPAKLEAILNAPLPPDDQLPEVTPKQLERIEAFELRAQSREEQGRPV